ncbi:hypothetical protein [Pendulispora albinea]|uniref:Uncharacterized protein n=1 Tax=Pendulispora albinea TaxID=2741071 RepID=A0ABZ2LTL8_9BACT
MSNLGDLNLHGARVVLRQRNVLDVVDLAMRFVALHGRAYAWLSLLVLVPSAAVTWLIGEGAGWGWGWFAGFFLSLLAGAPFTVLASRLMFTDKVRTRDVLLAALRTVPRLIVARVVQTISVGLAAFFFVLPAAWVQALLLFLPEVLLLEQAKVIPAMARAGRIAHAQVGNVVIGVLLMTAFTFGTPFLVDACGRMLLDGLLEVHPPDALTSAGGGALSTLGFWMAVPFVTTIRFLLYIDLRTRTEGWDIQTRFAALAARTYPQDEGALA